MSEPRLHVYSIGTPSDTPDIELDQRKVSQILVPNTCIIIIKYFDIDDILTQLYDILMQL